MVVSLQRTPVCSSLWTALFLFSTTREVKGLISLVTGIITSYGLWLDGVLVLNSSSSRRVFVVEGLLPWSRHLLRLQACTARGCGKGPMVSKLLFQTTEQLQLFAVSATELSRPRGSSNGLKMHFSHQKFDSCFNGPAQNISTQANFSNTLGTNNARCLSGYQ